MGQHQKYHKTLRVSLLHIFHAVIGVHLLLECTWGFNQFQRIICSTGKLMLSTEWNHNYFTICAHFNAQSANQFYESKCRICEL